MGMPVSAANTKIFAGRRLEHRYHADHELRLENGGLDHTAELDYRQNNHVRKDACKARSELLRRAARPFRAGMDDRIQYHAGRSQYYRKLD